MINSQNVKTILKKVVPASVSGDSEKGFQFRVREDLWELKNSVRVCGTKSWANIILKINGSIVISHPQPNEAEAKVYQEFFDGLEDVRGQHFGQLRNAACDAFKTATGP